MRSSEVEWTLGMGDAAREDFKRESDKKGVKVENEVENMDAS